MVRGDESTTKLSNEYKVGKSTQSQNCYIKDIKKQLDSSDWSTSCKMLKLVSNTDLDDTVYKWFSQKRSQGELISGLILYEKAVQSVRKTKNSEGYEIFKWAQVGNNNFSRDMAFVSFKYKDAITAAENWRFF